MVGCVWHGGPGIRDDTGGSGGACGRLGLIGNGGAGGPTDRSPGGSVEAEWGVVDLSLGDRVGREAVGAAGEAVVVRPDSAMGGDGVTAQSRRRRRTAAVALVLWQQRAAGVSSIGSGTVPTERMPLTWP